MQNNMQLSVDEMSKLRDLNLLSENEYAYRAGDLIVAEDLFNKQKRVLGRAQDVLAESNKRVLKG